MRSELSAQRKPHTREIALNQTRLTTSIPDKTKFNRVVTKELERDNKRRPRKTTNIPVNLRSATGLFEACKENQYWTHDFKHAKELASSDTT